MKFYPYHPNGERPHHGNTPFIDSKQNIWTTLMWTGRNRQVGPQDRRSFPVHRPYALLGSLRHGDRQEGQSLDRRVVCLQDRSLRYEHRQIHRVRAAHQALQHPPRFCGSCRHGLVCPWIAGERSACSNPDTGKLVEYDEPVPFGFPYDIQEDSENNLWIADSGQGGGLYKFDTQTEEVHVFPAPFSATDMPKISVSKEDSIWYTTRGGDLKTMALGVLYPDKTRIKTLAAYLQ